MNNKIILSFLTLILLFNISSAETWKYNYLGDDIIGDKYYNITNTYNNYTVNGSTFDTEHFDEIGDVIYISESWLTVFIEDIVEGYNYITGAEVSSYETDPMWNAQKGDYAKYQFENNNFNGSGNITANRYSTILNTSIGLCTNLSGDTMFGYIEGAC